MTRRHVLIAALAIFGAVSIDGSKLRAQSGDTVYAELLGKYVVAGPAGINWVSYAEWKANTADLRRLGAYLSDLRSRKPSTMPRAEAFAFWVNLYNAATLKVVLDKYPVKSIRDIESTGTSLFDFKAYTGPWRTKLVTIEGRSLSLDEIEHSILRPQFKDPRVHYAITCASIGCPNLKPTPWNAATLDADLDAAAKDYINHPRGVSVRNDGGLIVSSIYDWFTEDFGGERGVIAHLRKFAGPELAKKLGGKVTIAGHGYDWTLNDARNAKVGG
jgi:hypothetical protein